MARLLYRFGDCSVDPAARELCRNGTPVTVSPKVFDVIAYLIDRRDRAVGRDELIAAVWGRADVTDALLGQVVLKARRAIGDTGDEQNAIRTIPRFGYRWVAELATEERPDPPPAAGPAVAGADVSGDRAPPVVAAPSPRRGRSRWAAAATVLALAVAVLTVLVLMRGRHGASPPASRAAPAAADAVAVLPLVIAAEPEWGWLRLGLMDLVATRLRGAGLAVVPNETIVALTRDPPVDAAILASNVRTVTGAQRLLTSSATRGPGGWRVRLELHPVDGEPILIEAQQPDAAAAARVAVAQLLLRLGKPVSAEATATTALDDVRQRAEAALLSDQLEEVQRIIQAAPPDVRDAPLLRLRLAQVDFRSGRMIEARAKLDRLLADVGPEADPVLRALILTVSSSVRIHLGDAAAAGRDCAAAVALVADRDEPGMLGRAYTACGIAEAVQGRFDAAMSEFARARIALEITGDALSLARIEANEGLMESTRGRYAEGLAVMRRSEEHFRRLGGRNEMMMALDDQIDALLALLQPLEALATSERAWGLLPQISNTGLRHSVQVQHARALAANGRLGEAAALLVRITSEAATEQDQPVLGHALAERARIELATGRADAAAGHAAEAVQTLAGPDRGRARAQAWLTRVRALRVLARDADAAAEVRGFADWAATAQVPASTVLAQLAQAELHSTAQPAAATAAYEQALAQAERAGIPADVVEVVVSWGNALLDAGQTERASAVAGRVQRWAGTDFRSSLLQARLYRALGQEAAWREALQRTQRLAGERPIPPTVGSALLAPFGAAPPSPPSD